ncbi:leucyl/phenylalanyl-tRNA--protein transferase [Legionella spiritensis]|uniref:leucyl/phenylalanyl-tRNA--protein transferase n=1 Tax=Legionella spiritensis TaxID=452 RepID=UPI000F7172DE|nr:leucyl/phenylalanyl-tRNA--protein transferase [Legionella spiritensis]VEG90575.1 leucyl/phenylalanyl-tRNA-protein transferase [Legionella spiritensis]
MYGRPGRGKISGYGRRLIISSPTFLDGDDFTFPDPESSDKEGLVAVGGDLSPNHLLTAYRQGIFPWYEPGYPILWWSPDPRLLLQPEHFRLSRSLKQALKKPYRVDFDTDFVSVIAACSSCSGRINNTWITGEMQTAYNELHNLGYAHSVEVRQEGQLIGGLYGISLGRAFFGESMFHLQRDASKIALYYLCQLLGQWQFDFIDCQLPTPHLQRLGARIVRRREFLQRLRHTLHHPTHVGTWLHHSIDS